MKNVIVIGGGFAGFWAAVSARRQMRLYGVAAPITVINRDPFLTLRPRLYETFGEHLRLPLAALLEPLDIELVIDDATAVTPGADIVTTRKGRTLPFGRLVVAAGSEQVPLPVPGSAEFAFDIDTFEAAARFDAHLESLLHNTSQPDQHTFVIIGAGFTGIELACELRQRIRLHSSPEIARSARVVLIEREAVAGPQLGSGPRPVIEAALRDAGVELLLKTRVIRMDGEGVELEGGAQIAAKTVVSTSGLRANRLSQTINVPLDALGRIRVDPHLAVPGVPGWYATGDVACARAEGEHDALMSCQHAMTMGKFAGANVARDLCGQPLLVYRQPNYQTCLDLGAYGAVLTRGWQRDVVQSGQEAKPIKVFINQKVIYPPANDAAALLAASAPPD
jgi:NADH dehydrogenase